MRVITASICTASTFTPSTENLRAAGSTSSGTPPTTASGRRKRLSGPTLARAVPAPAEGERDEDDVTRPSESELHRSTLQPAGLPRIFAPLTAGRERSVARSCPPRNIFVRTHVGQLHP